VIVIGLAVQIPGDPSRVFVFFLVIPSSPGNPRNSRRFLVLLLRPNTVPWPPQAANLLGSLPCFMTFMFLIPKLPFYIVTAKLLCILELIRFFTSELSTLN
jgi:hypothetical protein